LDLTANEGGNADRKVNNVMHDGGEESGARRDGE